MDGRTQNNIRRPVAGRDGLMFLMRKSAHLTRGLHDWCEAIPPQYRTKVVEVGSWAGESALIFAEYFCEVICVDDWKIDLPFEKYGCTIEDVYQAFLQNTKDRLNIWWRRQPSFDAAKTFDDYSLPAVYVDAQHTYEHVSVDIAAWLPKIQKGGYIGGHDYSDNFPGVQRAVAELLLDRPVQTFKDTSWLVRVD